MYIKLHSAVWTKQKNWIKLLREGLYKVLGT